jgi:hydrogenase maturation protease
MPVLHVIGVGNPFRRDDGAGVAVARRLRAAALPGVVVVEASGEGTALMDAWRDAAAVVVVDAVRSGADAGTVFRFDARQETLPARFFHYSTHAFGVAEAVEVGRALGQLPPRLVLYGIEGKVFDAGTGLSPEVEAAVAAVARQVLADATHEREAARAVLPHPEEVPRCTSDP